MDLFLFDAERTNFGGGVFDFDTGDCYNLSACRFNNGQELETTLN